MSLRVITKSTDETDLFAAMFSSHIPRGTTIALNGTLGAGKTRFVQGVAKSLGMAPRSVTSPTFVLCNEYPGDTGIYHLDAYRLQDDDQFLELGPEEMYNSDNYTFIEWADRVQRCLPREHLTIEIEIVNQTTRQFSVSGTESFDSAIGDWINAIQP